MSIRSLLTTSFTTCIFNNYFTIWFIIYFFLPKKTSDQISLGTYVLKEHFFVGFVKV